VIAIYAALVLVAAAGVKLWASLTLLYRYRAEDYVAFPQARPLYLAHLAMPVVMGAAIVTLAYCTGLRWVEIPAWFVFAFAAWKCVRALRVRASQFRPVDRGAA
jgi:hypothetical protein